MTPNPPSFSEHGHIEPRPFRSGTPLFGPLLVWFRTQWNNVAARWYVQELVDQQNTHNQRVIAELGEQDARLRVTDEDLVAVTRQVGEMAVVIKQLQHRVAELEQQIEAQ